MRTLSKRSRMNAEELRERLEQARLDIKSSDPKRNRQGQADLEAIAAEADAKTQRDRDAQDQRIGRILEGEGPGKVAGVSMLVVGGLGGLLLIATIRWAFLNGLSWVWDALILASIALGTYVLALVVFAILTAIIGALSEARFEIRQRPKAVARVKRRAEARHAREMKRQKRQEGYARVRSFSLEDFVVGGTYRLLDLSWVWLILQYMRVRLLFTREPHRRLPTAREVFRKEPLERRQFIIDSITPEPRPAELDPPPERPWLLVTEPRWKFWRRSRIVPNPAVHNREQSAPPAEPETPGERAARLWLDAQKKDQ